MTVRTVRFHGRFQTMNHSAGNLQPCPALCLFAAPESSLLGESTPPGSSKCVFLQFIIKAMKIDEQGCCHHITPQSPVSGAMAASGWPLQRLVGSGEEGQGPVQPLQPELHSSHRCWCHAAGMRGADASGRRGTRRSLIHSTNAC